MTDGTIQEQDDRLTIFLVLDAEGDVLFGTNTPELELPQAISILEMAKAKMIAQTFQIIAQKKQEAQQKANTKPRLFIPNTDSPEHLIIAPR